MGPVRPHSAEVSRSIHFKVRLSAAEHAALRKHASACGLRPTDIVRQFIRGLNEFEPKKSRKKG